MTSLEDILKNFYFQHVDGGNKFPKFGKPGRTDYIFTCKRCGSQSEPMKFEQDIKYRLVSHLTRYFNPSTTSGSQEQEDQQQEQGSVE
jgi:hypothetical protein